MATGIRTKTVSARTYNYVLNRNIPGPNQVSSDYAGEYKFPSQFDDRVDWQTDPNYRIKIANAQNASLPYYRHELKILRNVMGTCDVEATYNPTKAKFAGFHRIIWPQYLNLATIVDDPTTADQALAKLKRKMNNRTQSYNLIVPLAELRELRQTVVGAAQITEDAVRRLMQVSSYHRSVLDRASRGLFDAAALVKDVKKLNLRRAYRQASNIWLTYSFGISPMMRTIQDIGKSISAYLTRYDSIDRLTGSASRDWKTSHGNSSIGTTVWGAEGLMRTEVSHQMSYRYIAGHKFLLESANDYDTVEHFGLKPASLIPTIWELTAFSWVVDYFTTVGSFLDDTFSGTTGSSVYVVKNRRYTASHLTRIWWRPTYSAPNYSYQRFSWNEGLVEANRFEFQRSVLTSLPARALRFRTLDEMGLGAVNKLLNLTSVLSKSFR